MAGDSGLLLLRVLGLATLLVAVVAHGQPGAAERRCFCQVGFAEGTGRARGVRTGP